MVVRCKPEMFTVFECRRLLKDSLKIDVVARTLIKVMNNAELVKKDISQDNTISCYIMLKHV